MIAVTCILLLAVGSLAGKAPNVVFIIADDLGWNDVGYHGSELKSPVIYLSVRYLSNTMRVIDFETRQRYHVNVLYH